MFPSQTITKRPLSPSSTPSFVTSSRSSTVDSSSPTPFRSSSTPDPLIQELLTTIEHLSSRVAALETAIQRHTSVTDDHIYTFTLNQQQIYNKLLLLLDQNATISSHEQPNPSSSEVFTIAPQSETPLPTEPQTASQPESSPATNTTSEPHLPTATDTTIEPNTSTSLSVTKWPPSQTPAPTAPLQVTPMDPSSEFQILYVPVHEKVTPARMRQKLRDIRLSSRMAIDVHFPAAHVMSLLVRNKHFDRCQKLLHAAHLTTLPTFDPLDPAHLFNPHFLNRSITERSVEMQNICRSQKLYALRRLSPELQIQIAQLFHQKSWIHQNDLNDIVRAAQLQLEEPSNFF